MKCFVETVHIFCYPGFKAFIRISNLEAEGFKKTHPIKPQVDDCRLSNVLKRANFDLPGGNSSSSRDLADKVEAQSCCSFGFLSLPIPDTTLCFCV